MQMVFRLPCCWNKVEKLQKKKPSQNWGNKFHRFKELDNAEQYSEDEYIKVTVADGYTLEAGAVKYRNDYSGYEEGTKAGDCIKDVVCAPGEYMQEYKIKQGERVAAWYYLWFDVMDAE